jgi:hypothetical protein
MAVQRAHVRDTGIYSESVIQSDLAEERTRAIEDCARAVRESNALTPEMKQRAWGRRVREHKKVFEASNKDFSDILTAKAERFSILYRLVAANGGA